MRFVFSIFLFVLAQPVFSDAYKCKGPNGQVVFTERPCENGFSHSSSARSYAADSDNAVRAQAEVQRQKEWLRQRESEQRGSAPQVVYASSPPYDLDVINACLMKITATPKLRPSEQARRKVRCYPGGVGLIENCKSSVHATMLLPSSEEAAIKDTCR